MTKNDAKKDFITLHPFYQYDIKILTENISSAKKEINNLQKNIVSELNNMNNIIDNLKNSWKTTGGEKTINELYTEFNEVKNDYILKFLKSLYDINEKDLYKIEEESKKYYIELE